MIPTITGIEAEKIIRKKSSAIMIVLLMIVQIILAVSSYKFRTKELDLGTGFQVAAFSIQYTLQLFALIVLAFSSMALSGEISSGTAKTILARNIRRRDFIIGKALALFIISLVVLAVIYLTGLVTGYFGGGLIALKDGGYTLTSVGRLTGSCFTSMLLFIPPLAALISFGILISTLIRGAGGAVSTGIILFIVLQMLSQVDKINTWLFSTYLSQPINIYAKITEGIFLMKQSYIYWNIGISSISTLLFLGLSIVIFSKKDLWS